MNKSLSLVFHAIFLSTLLTLAHGLLKWASDQKNDSYLKTLFDSWHVIGLALLIYTFIFFYYIFVLKSNPISVLYPVYTGLSIFFVLIAGNIFFNENINIFQMSGALLIITGVIFMAIK